MEEKKKRMKELVDLLNRAGRAYYQEADEIMSNYEYDALYDELVRLEKETGTLCSTGTSEHCFLTKSYKPLSLKRSYPHFYEKIMEAVHNGM